MEFEITKDRDSAFRGIERSKELRAWALLTIYFTELSAFFIVASFINVVKRMQTFSYFSYLELPVAHPFER